MKRTGGITKPDRKPDTDIYTHPAVAKCIFQYLKPHFDEIMNNWIQYKESPKIFDVCSGKTGVLGNAITDLFLHSELTIQDKILYGKSILDEKCYNTHYDIIACEDMGFEYIGTELDPDYHRDALERLEIFRSQGKLWEDI